MMRFEIVYRVLHREVGGGNNTWDDLDAARKAIAKKHFPNKVEFVSEAMIETPDSGKDRGCDGMLVRGILSQKPSESLTEKDQALYRNERDTSNWIEV